MIGAIIALGATAPALAAGADDAPAVRWSVKPANETGPDGRTFVENVLDPGQSVDDHFAVHNVSDQAVEFQLTAADGFYTRTGRFDILPADETSVDAGTWISLPPTVTVPAGETVVVPFTITTPQLVEPGDHAAGITASVLSVQKSQDGTAVGVESRVGFRVTTRVTGQLTPKAAVESVTGHYQQSWNPLRPGQMTVTFDVANQGNSILLAAGTVEAGGQVVSYPAEGAKSNELLPGDTRTITVVVDNVWPLFLVPTQAIATATVVPLDGEESTLAPVAADVLAWAVPWPQLIVLIGILLLIATVFWGRIRSHRKLAAIVEEAREQGRREAGTPIDAPHHYQPSDQLAMRPRRRRGKTS